MITLRRAWPVAPRLASLQSFRSHQSCNPGLADCFALLAQFHCHPRVTIGLSRGGKLNPDLGSQLCVPVLPHAALSLFPGKVATARDAQGLAQHDYWII